ncbi:N-acetyl sugar amidotransferase [Pelagibacteraceae bacterium]|nr:N-acetyl sugar amidotransferase [Pelagibacteraceae bacterium]
MKTKIIQTCTKCLNDNQHPFGLDFNSEGICYGCIIHKEKRNNKLFLHNEDIFQNEINDLRNKSYKYDCIIPIRGSAEDYFVVNYIINKELNPLIVIVNNHFLNDLAWHNIHNLITYFDVDSITYTPDIFLYKSMVRSSLVKFNDIYWPYRYFLQTYSLKLAIDKKVPLIVWGGLQPIEYCGKFSHSDIVQMSEWSLKEHDLHGTSIDNFLTTGSRFNFSRILSYPIISETKKIKGIYLSNYIPWDPWKQNSTFEQAGFLAEDFDHTFDQYENVGSSVYYQIHDLLRLEKYSYKKVREQFSREIRHKRITRENAQKLMKIYQNQNYSIDNFFKWLDVTNSGKKWWIKHKLPKTNNLIGNNRVSINWQKSFISYFTNKSIVPEEKFVTFKKGI